MANDSMIWHYRVAVIALFLSMVLSWALWIPNERNDFPLVPLVGDAFTYKSGSTQSLINWGLFCTLALSGLFSIYKPSHAKSIWLLLICLMLLCLQDMTRFQPWVWFFAITLAFFAISKAIEPGSRRFLLLFLIGTLYFWSGFHKLNPFFAHDGFKWFCSAYKITERIGAFPQLGYTVALLEMLLLPGLLWSRTRPFFKYLIVLFHLLVSAVLLRSDWNLIVIPWNIVMALLVWMSVPSSYISPKDRSNKATVFAMVLFLIPVLSIFQLIPRSFGWYLYDDTQPEYSYQCGKIKPTQISYTTRFAEVWEKHAYDDQTKLLLDDWAVAAFGVPLPYHDAYAKKVANFICSKYHEGSLMILKVDSYRYDSEKIISIPCE